MGILDEKREEPDQYEFMMGMPRGRLAVALDVFTDALTMAGVCTGGLNAANWLLHVFLWAPSRSLLTNQISTMGRSPPSRKRRTSLGLEIEFALTGREVASNSAVG